MRAIINGRIIFENTIDCNRALVFNTQIQDICSPDKLAQCEDLCIIDAQGNYVSPGFMDIHVHGAGGHDVMDGSVEAIKTISSAIAKNGVTSFLPTTMTMSREAINDALCVIREATKMKLPGASALGAHLEGPFISLKRKGAQNEEYVLPPDTDFVSDYLDVIRIITLAPETDINFEFIKEMGVYPEAVLSVGHSDATYEQCMSAIELGVRHATHTFNGMSPLHHRKPGVVGAVLNSNITCEVIADNVHVHPAVYELLIKVKGTDRACLVTDSMRAAGMPNGEYDLGGQKVRVQNGVAMLENGSLAGSVLAMNMALRNVKTNTGLGVAEVVQMATINPARVIGLDNTKGSIAVGKDADIVVFDDDFRIHKTLVAGEIVFSE